MRIFGVILAGGEGRRMGGADKALLPLAGQPLLAHVMDRIQPQVEQLALSANGDPARFRRFGLPVLPDDHSMGPLSGLLSALQWAAGKGADALVTVPVDAPFLPPDLVPRLLLASGWPDADQTPAIARTAGKTQPVCGLWPTALAPMLANFLTSGINPKVMAFATAQNTAFADFPADNAFRNLNTPADLAEAEALLKETP
jgi:molybdopterin-guanine dinucleotide biosynthesis protein A